jgi:aromatic ring hydroxylase
MGARSGEQFLKGLRGTRRQLWLEGRLVDDVTAHPALAGAARTLAGVFDRLHEFPEECLVPDPETGEPLNVGHLIPRSVDDLKRRNRGLARIAEATVGLMGRTPDYMNVKFASFAARWRDWLSEDGGNAAGARNIVEYQKRLAREDISLTHTIIHPTIDKSTDTKIVGSRVPVHRSGRHRGGSWCGGRASWPRSRPSPTRSRCTRRCRCPPAPRPTRWPSRSRWTRPA